MSGGVVCSWTIKKFLIEVEIEKKPKKVRILHGPYNFSGIGGMLAKLQRSNGLNSKCIIYQSREIYPNHDSNLELNKKPFILRPFIMAGFLIYSLFKFDVFHFYAGKSFFILNLDLPILKLFGKKILMTYTGSDIRLINTVEKEHNPYFNLLQFDFSGHKSKKKFNLSFLNTLKDFFVFSYNHPKFDKRKIRMMKFHDLWIDIFFAIKGNYLNAASVINKEKIISDIYINHINLGIIDETTALKQSSNTTPVIVHAPNHPLAKGTNYFEDTLGKLKNDGVQFEYIRISGIPNEEVQEIYQNKADIMVDQFIAGDFGTFSLEGMKYGKAVVCYLRDDLIKNHYPDCPIYNVNIDNMYEKLKILLQNEQLRIELGAKGPQFVKKYVNIDDIVENVKMIYQRLYSSKIY